MTEQEKEDLLLEFIQAISKKYFLIEKAYNFDHETPDMKSDAFIENIIFQTCKYFSVTKDYLLSGRRKNFSDNYSFPEVRFMIFNLCRELPERPISLGKIGVKFGKDHATVLHGIEKCKGMIEFEKTFSYDYHCIKKLVNESLKL